MSDVIKEAIAKEAVKLVKANMIIGLGTGTTANSFIRCLAKKIRDENLKIKAVASSKATEKIAKEENIDLLNSEEMIFVDLYFDGADEIDPEKNMIKGRGGALLREKVLAYSAKEMIVLVDDSKLVAHLGYKSNLPVEIVPFALAAVEIQLKEEGYVGKYRLNKDGSYYLTDNENVIFDVLTDKNEPLTRQDHDIIKEIPSVVETGLFFDVAGRIVVGYAAQKVEILN